MSPLYNQERSIQNEKCGRCEGREDPPLKAQCFPEHVHVAERPEPEHFHVIRQHGATTEEDGGKDDENEKKAARTPRRTYARPVRGLRHSPPRVFDSTSTIRLPSDDIVQCLKKLTALDRSWPGVTPRWLSTRT